MIERTYKITDPNGLHARPAAVFVKAMALCPGTVQVKFQSKSANAKSILSVLSLGVSTNNKIDVLYGTDELRVVSQCEEAVDFLEQF